MSDANRCIAGQTFKFAFIAEASGSSSPQTSPTLAAADFRISVNGGALAALTNTPTNTPSGSAWVEVILAAAETTAAAAAGMIRFQAIDAAGSEWKYWGCLIPVFADEQASVGSAMTLADNAITAGKIAADAIGASELAADAVTKIQNGLATPTNITAGTITTVTNLTNAPTSGDLTATMKSSVTTAATAATPTAAAVTGNVGGSVAGSVGSVAGSVASVTAPVTAGTVTDKTGYSLSTTPPTAEAIRIEIDSNSTQLNKLGTPTGASVSADIAAVKTDTAAILVDTGTDGVAVASGSKSGYSLTADQSGVTVGTANALGTQAKADVNAEIVDALNVDTYAEPTSAPAATSSLAAKIRWLFKLNRNKIAQSSSTTSLYADDGTTVDSTTTTSDDGTVFIRNEWS